MAPRSTAPREDLADLMARLNAMAANEHIGNGPVLTVRDLLAAIGRRTYGPLLLLIGLFSISPATILPGMTWFSAAVALFFGTQLMFGMRFPWIPHQWCDAQLRRDVVRAATRTLQPWAHRIDMLLRPRLTFLAEAPFANLIGALCVIAALVTFPLGLIPVAPLAPGLAILALGLGLFAHDGLFLLTGTAIAIGAVSLALVAVL